MKRRNRRLIGFLLVVVLLFAGGIAFLHFNPETPLLAKRARQIYTFAPDSIGFRGWQSDHSFLYSIFKFPVRNARKNPFAYYVYDVDSHEEKQVAMTPSSAKAFIRSRKNLTTDAFANPMETYSKQVNVGPQAHADIQLGNGRGFNEVWPPAFYAGTGHVVFADRVVRDQSALEKLWLKYILRKPVPRPKDCVRIWTCRRDGTRLHLVGEGPLIPEAASTTGGSAVYSLQQCQLSQDEKTLRFVWGSGVWSVPIED